MPPSPERLDRYQIILPIASGGMATVYLARSRGAGGFEREVAIKRLHPHLLADAADAAIDLIEEAKLASRIRHPNVVPVLDVGDGPDGVFLVMEYIEGVTLSALLRAAATAGAPMPIPIALRVLGDALAGLHAAHEVCDEAGAPAGLVHRDFSPQNILLGTDGVARLTDFGIAKAATRQSSTQTGFVKGKVGYMAPEQARACPLNRRCDVWAAGVVAWEVFAGRRLYSPNIDPVAIVLSIVSEPPPRLRSVRPDVPAELDEAIAWALQTDADARCPTVDELRHRILAAFGRDVTQAEPSEVAAHVAEVAGPALAERRRRIAEAESVTVPRAAPTSDPAALPAATVEQRFAAEGATDLNVSVPGVTPGVAQLPASAIRDPQETQLASSRRLRRLAMTTVAIAVVAGSALWAISSLRAEAASSEPRTGAADSTTATAPAVSTAPASTAVSPASAVPSSAPAPAERTVLNIQANAAIAQLKIGERVVAVASPSKMITVELLPEERERSLSVQATTADGRRAAEEDVAGANTVLTFGSAGATPPPVRRGHGSAAGPAGAPAKRSAKPGLMASPYEKPSP